MKPTKLNRLMALIVPLGAFGQAASAYVPQSTYQRKHGKTEQPALFEASLEGSMALSSFQIRSSSPGTSELALKTGQLSRQDRQTPATDINIKTGVVVKELIVLDASVPNPSAFTTELKPGIDVRFISADEEGLKALGQILSAYHDLDAIHLVSHAHSGVLQLGSQLVDQKTLKEDPEFFGALNNAVKESGDLLLYGCNLASDRNGEAFVDLIRSQSHVEVAASTDETGHAEQGGDWELELQRGAIESDIPFSAHSLRDFTAVLGLTSGSGTIDMSGFTQGYGQTKSYTTDSKTVRMSSDSSNSSALYCYTGPAYDACWFDTTGVISGLTKGYIDFSSGENFDVSSVYLYNESGSAQTFTLTSPEGSSLTTPSFSPNSGSQINLGWTNVSQITIQKNDGSELNSVKIDDLVLSNVRAANTAPSLTIDGLTLPYTEGNSALQIDHSATINDPDGNADWSGGTLSAQITANADADDQVSISDMDGDGTAITISGTNIFSNGVDIGDLSASGGSVTGGTNLAITFDSDATNANVQEVLQSIRYNNPSEDPGTSARTITFTATDANAGSNSDTRMVSMTSVNDEPTLTATGSNPTFVEGGAAASLFSGTSVNTIESGQTVTGLTFTVTNVTNGSNERINIDGTTIVLTHGTNGSTASNSLNYSVSVIGTTATVTMTGGTLSTAAAQTLIDNASYQNNSNSPSTSNRVVTLTSIQDSGGTANGGDNTGSLAVASTVTVVQNNDEPTLTGNGSNPTFTEGGASSSLFNSSNISTVEAGQTINGLTFTVSNVSNGVSEVIYFDGTAIVLTHGTSGSTAGTSLSYTVSVVGTTATITITGGTMSTAHAQTLIDTMSYQNNSSTPNTSNRVVTITSLQDSGGTANGGDDTAALAVSSTITLVGVNDEPTLTATASNPTFTEGGAAASLFSNTSVNTIESGQTVSGLSFTVTNVTNGSNERINIDGTTIVLTHGTNGSTAGNSLNYSVSVIGTTATVTMTGGTLSTAAAQTLIDNASYQNNSNSPSTSNRVVTLTSIQDSGGTANGGDNTGSLAVASTVTVVQNNDEPTLTGNGSNPTFTEGGAASSLFNGSNISTVEAGQTINGLTFTVSNVSNGVSEVIYFDGTAIVLTHGTSGSTGGNSLTYTVSVVGTTATITVTGGTMSTATAQTLIDNVSYQNNSDTPDSNNRVVTITSLQDSGGTANGGDDTAALSVSSTITLIGVNDEPTLTATASNPTFTEGGTAASLFSGTIINTIESGQTVTGLTFTVTNVADGSNERINIDGTTIVLTHGTNGSTASNNLNYRVSVIGTTATVTMTGGTLSTAATQTLIDNASYQNNSNSPSTSNRVVTLTSIQDSGGTANGGDNTGSLAVASTVTVVEVNADTTATNIPSDVTFTEDATGELDLSAVEFSDIDSGSITVTLKLSNGSFATPANGSGVGGGVTATLVNSTTITLSGSPADINTYLDTTDNIQYTGDSNAAGDDQATLTIYANGGNGSSDVELATINIDITATNDAPTLNTNTGTRVDEGETAVITTTELAASDVDDSATGLTYTITRNVAHGTLFLDANANATLESGEALALDQTFTQHNVDEGNVLYVHDGSETTSDDFEFSLADGGENGAADVTGQTFNITIAPLNDAPVISGIAATSLLTGTPYSFTPSVEDSDTEDTLTFSVSGQPAWLEFDNETGALTGTPGDADVGTYSGIQITVSDGIDSDSLAAFAITVAESPDTDGDTISDYQEGLDNTDPNDASDYLDLMPPQLTAPGEQILDAQGLFTQVTLRQLLGLSESATDAQLQTALNTLTSDNIDGAECCNPRVVSMEDGALRLKPGRHEIRWSAEDRKGNTAEMTQVVNVRPLVSLSKDQVTVEGTTMTVSVLLNGKSPFYPFTVPLVIDEASTAGDLDHNLVEGTVTFNEVDGVGEIRASINFDIFTDELSEGDETLVVRLDDRTTNAEDLVDGYNAQDPNIFDINSGSKTRHVVRIVERNLAPEARLQLTQGGANTVLVTPAGGEVTATVQVNDPNTGDTQSLDWSASSNSLVDSDGDNLDNTLVFDPSGLTPGRHKVEVSVTDSEGLTGTARMFFRVQTQLPNLSTATDTDGDGIDDQSEGTSDTDDDGIPEYLDNISASNVLPEAATQTDEFLMECDPGVRCRLGQFALLSESGGAELSDEDVATQSDLSEDLKFDPVGGIFDFEVNELPEPGQSVSVVIPQRQPIPEEAVYRKFQNGEWVTFVENENNLLHSAQGNPGYCPPPGDATWEAGLVPGHHCVQLTIEDGGPNDADGEVNGAVADPGAISRPVAEDPEEPTPDPEEPEEPEQPTPSPEPEEPEQPDPEPDEPGYGGEVTTRSSGSGSTSALFGGLLLALGLGRLSRRPRGVGKRARSGRALAWLPLLALASLVFPAEQAQALSIEDMRFELGVYRASSAITASEFATAMENRGSPIALSEYDVSRRGLSLEAAMPLSPYFGIGVGYLSLGDVNIDFDVIDASPESLRQGMAEHYPYSAAGWTLTPEFRLPLEGVTFIADVGLYRWESETTTMGPNIPVQERDGVDPLAGIGFELSLSERVNAGFTYRRVFLDDQDIDLMGVSLNWRL